MSTLFRFCAITMLGIAGLLAGLSDLAASPGQIYQIKTERTALRDSPLSDAPVVAWLAAGDRVIEYEARKPWVRVAVFGGQAREGWIELASLNATARETLPIPVPEPEPVPLPLPYSEPTFLLDITGTPALKYIGHCWTVDFDGNRQKISLNGFVPKLYVFRTAALRCIVQKWDARGRLTVALRFENRDVIAARSTAARFNYVRVFTNGPWGAAGSVRGNIPTLVFNRDRGSGVSPRPKSQVRANAAQ